MTELQASFLLYLSFLLLSVYAHLCSGLKNGGGTRVVRAEEGEYENGVALFCAGVLPSVPSRFTSQ